ncbi:MAG TPA: adenylate/guanylate cyclase domain-containing protein, partial [Candidatus Ozemobacteraceae bacterium]|nr:adenylate/guanylate cyclase domain-containing protein [Candidatus Ozemobacteraceae bacterium]
LTTTLDPEKVFTAITEMLVQELGVARYILFLHDRSRNELYPFRWAGFKDEIRDSLILPVDKVEHFLTWSFSRGQLVYRNAALDDPETRGLVDRDPLPDTLVAMPIGIPGETFGMIYIESFQDNRQEVDEADLRFMVSLVSFMGMAISNANVFLQTRTELTSSKQLSERELAEKKKLKDIFSKYTSAELVDTLLANPGSVNLGGIEKNATILFSDIAGFTAFSSGLAPAQVVAAMNEYLSAMTDVVLEHDGEIDKFIGDAVMARFGVLGNLPSSGRSAIEAALAMLDRLRQLQAKWAQENRECFKIRIGIASGPVLAGNIGSERRQEFTVMGSTVNLASRLEALNKEFKTTILVDENTFAQVAKEVRAIPHENVQIRGMEGRLRVYEIQGMVRAKQENRKELANVRSRLASVRTEPVAPAEPDNAPRPPHRRLPENRMTRPHDRLILFDIDGTLLSADRSGYYAIERSMIDVLGAARGLEGIRLDGNTDLNAIRQVCDRDGTAFPDQESISKFKDHYTAILRREIAGKGHLKPGVGPLLNALASSGRACLGLVTG